MLILRMVTRRHLSFANNTTYQIRLLSTAHAQKEKEVLTNFKQKLPAAQPKKPKREPFAKNLFLGKFDYEFMTYPEPQHVDRYNEFEEWLEPIQCYMKTINPKEIEESDSIPPHVLQQFRELGIFGARIHGDYMGMNLLNSEFMRVLEVVGTVPSLGLFLLKQGIPAIDIFNKYCSVEQKLKYLPKIAAGQSMATIAATEPNAGPIANNIECIATLSDCNEYWIINGEKTFVSNASMSDIFIVYGHAMDIGDLEKRPETMASFIVERDTPGLTVSKNDIKNIGLKGFNTGRINLQNAKIPKNNLIGNIGNGAEQLMDLFTNGRHFIAALTIPLLKNLQQLLIKDVLQRKHFNIMLYETQTAKKIFADINCSIYAIESILYLTTAIIDIYDNQDVQLETALVEQFCVQECIKRVQESMWLVGPRVCTLVEPYEKILRDTFTLTNYETSLLDTKIYSALLGLQHYGLTMAEKIKKERNPLMFPMYLLSKMFKKQGHLKLHLEEYLHPSLRECTDFCDRSLFKLKEATENLIISSGLEVGKEHIHLQRLSDIASIIYAYVAILSRSSRSYCIGNKHSETELQIAIIMAYRLQQQVFNLSDDINIGEYANGDYIAMALAEMNYKRKGYYASHPLQRNY